MGWLDAAIGGLSGLATGGPAGAAIGALGGLVGNNDGRTEAGVDLRPLTPGESAANSAALAKIKMLAQSLGMGTDPASLEKLYQAIYQPQARAINEAYTRMGSAEDAANLRRGTGPSSRMQEAITRRQGQQAQALGDASAQATLGARQMGISQDAATAAGINSLGGLTQGFRQGQIAGGTQFSRTPGAGVSEGLAGLATSLTDNNSWVRNLFGGV